MFLRFNLGKENQYSYSDITKYRQKKLIDSFFIYHPNTLLQKTLKYGNDLQKDIYIWDMHTQHGRL